MVAVAFNIGGDFTWTGSTTLNGAVQSLTATTGDLSLATLAGNINLNAFTSFNVSINSISFLHVDHSRNTTFSTGTYTLTSISGIALSTTTSISDITISAQRHFNTSCTNSSLVTVGTSLTENIGSAYQMNTNNTIEFNNNGTGSSGIVFNNGGTIGFIVNSGGSPIQFTSDSFTAKVGTFSVNAYFADSNANIQIGITSPTPNNIQIGWTDSSSIFSGAISLPNIAPTAGALGTYTNGNIGAGNSYLVIDGSGNIKAITPS